MTVDPGRRWFLTRITKSGLAVAAFGIAACGDGTPATTAAPSATTAAPPATTLPPTTSTVAVEPAPTTTKEPTPGAASWERVDLGFVSAYVMVRAGEIAIIDTGTSGSAGDIEAVIGATGLGWNNVGHVIATHSHGDHVGSLAAVLELAAGATPYAGAGDIPAIDSPRPLQAVGDGDRVFDLAIIETPGHTPGHISVLDDVGGVLLAGDALNGQDGGVIGANPQFTPDIPTADLSVQKLGTFDYETILFGHGEPVLSMGSQLVRELAASI